MPSFQNYTCYLPSSLDVSYRRLLREPLSLSNKAAARAGLVHEGSKPQVRGDHNTGSALTNHDTAPQYLNAVGMVFQVSLITFLLIISCFLLLSVVWE